MSSATLEQAIEIVSQLSAEEQIRLVRHIAGHSPTFTHEMLQLYFTLRRMEGATNESLYGKYANPAVDVSFEELQAYLHEIGTEWEKEIDEFGLTD